METAKISRKFAMLHGYNGEKYGFFCSEGIVWGFGHTPAKCVADMQRGCRMAGVASIAGEVMELKITE